MVIQLCECCQVGHWCLGGYWFVEWLVLFYIKIHKVNEGYTKSSDATTSMVYLYYKFWYERRSVMVVMRWALTQVTQDTVGVVHIRWCARGVWHWSTDSKPPSGLQSPLWLSWEAPKSVGGQCMHVQSLYMCAVLRMLQRQTSFSLDCRILRAVHMYEHARYHENVPGEQVPHACMTFAHVCCISDTCLTCGRPAHHPSVTHICELFTCLLHLQSQQPWVTKSLLTSKVRSACTNVCTCMQHRGDVLACCTSDVNLGGAPASA